jgi:hypothetical protein
MENITIYLAGYDLQGCIQKFLDWVHNEIYTHLWYYWLKSNTKGYGSKTHKADSQNSDTTAPSGRTVPFAVVTPAG